MTITYELGNSLYINITNRCSNRCEFCIRNNEGGISDGVDLWLDKEPEASEVIDSVFKWDLSKFKEIVFCGYGEPMYRMDEIVEISKAIKEKVNIKIRINTNGHANLIHGKDITQALKGLIDTVSISLNAKDAKEYDSMCKSDFGIEAYQALLDFAKNCKEYVPNVVLSVVEVMPKDDIERCRAIASEIGVQFRIRELI